MSNEIARYKNTINKYKSEIQRSPMFDGRRRILYHQMLLFDYLEYTFRVYTDKLKLEVYQEGEILVFGIPLSTLECDVKIEENVIRRMPGYMNYRLERLIDLKFPEKSGETKKYVDDGSLFLKDFKEYISEIENNAKSGVVFEMTSNGVYPKYVRKDIIPVLSIDFDKNKILYYSTSINKGKALGKVELYDSKENSIFDIKTLISGYLIQEIPWKYVSFKGNEYDGEDMSGFLA